MRRGRWNCGFKILQAVVMLSERELIAASNNFSPALRNPQAGTGQAIRRLPSSLCKDLLLELPQIKLTQRNRPRSHSRPGSQMVHMLHRPRHIKNRRSRVTLLAVRPIPATVNMVLTDVVFAAERVFKVSGALVERSSLRTAAFPMMHAASHICLTFPYAKKRTTKVKSECEPW
jgi:hypothetical protein